MAKVYLADVLTPNGQKRVKIWADTVTDKFYWEDDNGVDVQFGSEVDVTNLESEMAGVTASIAEIEEDIAGVTASISNIEQSLGSATASIADLEGYFLTTVTDDFALAGGTYSFVNGLLVAFTPN
jgi:archaellum component FlaC